jgi:hypothetical protein
LKLLDEIRTMQENETYSLFYLMRIEYCLCYSFLLSDQSKMFFILHRLVPKDQIPLWIFPSAQLSKSNDRLGLE